MKAIWIMAMMVAVGLGAPAAGARGSSFQQRGTPTDNAARQTESGMVVGVVRNPYTKEPIDSVNVSMIAAAAGREAQGRGRGTDTPRQVVTDGNGRFTFTNVAPGSYAVRAEREGYFSATVNQTSAGVVSRPTNVQAAISVNVQPAPMNVVLELIPGGSIRGRVYDRDGRLSPNVLVNVLRESFQDGRIVLTSATVRFVATDERGEFRFWGLAPDRYYLQASTRANAALNQQSLTTYYPAEAGAKRAQALTLQSGVEIPADIHLTSVTPIKISGNVVGMNPQLQTPVRFALVPRDSEVSDSSEMTRSDQFAGRGALPNNAFELQAQLPGRYDVFATMAAANGAVQSAALAGRVSVDVIDRDIRGLTLTLRPTVTLQVRFVGNGDPQIGSQVSNPISLRSRDLLPPSLAVRNETLAARTASRTGLTETAPNPADGDTFSSITEGRYVVESGLQALRDAYVADIRQGSKSIYEDGTIIVGADRPERVDVILARPAGMIQGVVQDATGKPFGSSLVVLIPEGRRRENPLLYKKATASADGQFTLQALAPGQYKIFAWENLPTGAERNGQFLARFEQFGRSVTVTAGSTISSVAVSVIRERQ